MGRIGWLLLGAVFVGAGAALVSITRWAESTRSTYAVHPGHDIEHTPTPA